MITKTGPEAPCQRTGACTAAEPHLGGAHIDPRNPLYDGPRSTITALGQGPREAARKLLDAGAPVPEVVELANEIHRLRDQIGHLMVDKDRAVRAASERALDCGEHGEQIKALEKQVHHFDRLASRNDRARLSLLDLLQQITDTVGAMRLREKLGQSLPTGKAMVDALDKAAKKAHDAHQRVWSK